jgi:hypothetical protein
MRPFSDQRQPLDEHHVLEPAGAGLSRPGTPLVRDLEGRVWRVRWRPAASEVLAAVAALLLAALLLGLVLLWL